MGLENDHDDLMDKFTKAKDQFFVSQVENNIYLMIELLTFSNITKTWLLVMTRRLTELSEQVKKNFHRFTRRLWVESKKNSRRRILKSTSKSRSKKSRRTSIFLIRSSRKKSQTFMWTSTSSHSRRDTMRSSSRLHKFRTYHLGNSTFHKCLRILW